MQALVRAVGFLASFIAVVAGCVALVGWLDSQGIPIGGAVALLALTLLWVRRIRFGSLRFSASDVVVTVGVVAFLVVTLVGLGTSERLPIAISAVVLAGAAWPLAWDLHEADKRSRKECPDCCETVKAGARVCRYCGYRWDR